MGNKFLKIINILISVDKIGKCIIRIIYYIEIQLTEKIINKTLFYAIQLDESTDTSNTTI